MMTLRIMTLSIMGLDASTSINDILNYVTKQTSIEFYYAECRYAECRYAECRYAKCRGATVKGRPPGLTIKYLKLPTGSVPKTKVFLNHHLTSIMAFLVNVMRAKGMAPSFSSKIIVMVRAETAFPYFQKNKNNT